MDLHCPKCGEPWDNDEFHDLARQRQTSYRTETKRFFEAGCEVFDGASCNPNTKGSSRAIFSAALREVLGDDTDGIASSMDDAEFMDLLD